MKGIVKFGLVIGVLLCGAVGAASAQEEFSEDYKEGYKDGFYMGLMYVCGANVQGSELIGLYNSLDGQPTDETVVVENETITWSDYYNEEATFFNQETVPAVNEVILQIFGPDDDRTEELLLPELPLIT
jgi:hypothetical protein